MTTPAPTLAKASNTPVSGVDNALLCTEQALESAEQLIDTVVTSAVAAGLPGAAEAAAERQHAAPRLAAGPSYASVAASHQGSTRYRIIGSARRAGMRYAASPLSLIHI